MQVAFSLSSSSSALVPRSSRVPRRVHARARSLVNTCAMAGTAFYDLTAKDIDGNEVNFADFKVRRWKLNKR